jgi:hypothetical protein
MGEITTIGSGLGSRINGNVRGVHGNRAGIGLIDVLSVGETEFL